MEEENPQALQTIVPSFLSQSTVVYRPLAAMDNAFSRFSKRLFKKDRVTSSKRLDVFLTSFLICCEPAQDISNVKNSGNSEDRLP